MPILVRDLGTLTYTHQEREGVLGKNENPDTIEGIVQMLKYQNASQVIKDLKAKIAEIKPQLDAMDVQIVPYIDRENLVRSTIDKVTHTVLEGIGLVCIVLIMFLGSWRSALVVAVTIPLAMMMAFVLMSLTKMSASMLSLGAIDFGIIVDGAIVVTENILRRREQQPTEELTPQDVRAATAQVARPIFFATLIIITAYFPLFALERGEARLFTPMAFTVGYALFGALLCTLALIPGLAYVALRRPRPMHHNRTLEWLTRAYQCDARTVHRQAQARCRGRRPRVPRDRISRSQGRPGLPAGARRRCALAPGPDAERIVGRHRDGDGEPAATHRARIPRSLLRRHPARAQRRRARCLDALAHRGPGRADARIRPGRRARPRRTSSRS